MKINEKLVELLKRQKLTISTAESITGGKIISSIIEVAGASKITEQSYIVYSNSAKMEVLGVGADIIEGFGVVSEEVAIEMARRLKIISNADIVISTTGEAGPQVNDEDIVIGTVCFGMIIGDSEYVQKKVFAGDRIAIIQSAADYILNDLYYKIS